jgi:hypothetical protein
VYTETLAENYDLRKKRKEKRVAKNGYQGFLPDSTENKRSPRQASKTRTQAMLKE